MGLPMPWDREDPVPEIDIKLPEHHSNLIPALMLSGNLVEAMQQAEEHVGAAFDHENAVLVAQQERTKSLLISRREPVQKQRREAEKKLANTPQAIPSARTTEECRPFSDWNWLEKAKVGSLVAMLLVLLPAAVYNVFGNLMAAQNPVFLQHPEIAFALSMLLLPAAFAFKCFAQLFAHAMSKKRYHMGLYAVAGVSVLLWIIEFSQTFHGLSDGAASEIVWSEVTGSSSGSAWLTFLQLLLETSLSAALFLSIEQVFEGFNGPREIENPVVALLEKQIDRSFQEEQRIEALLAQAEGNLNRIAHARKSVIQAAKTKVSAAYNLIQS